jgi:CBS domain-containing protein
MPIHKRNKKLVDLKVKNLMSSPAVTLPITSSLSDVVEKMHREKVGSVIITDENNRIAGIITERDIIYAAAKGLFKRGDVKVEYLMSKNVITVNEDSSIYEAVDKMISHNIRHLPVVDSQGKPIGLISIRDLIDFSASLLKIVMLPTENWKIYY